jgi:hypothetical protein
MLLEDEIEDDDDDDISVEEGEPRVTIFPLAEPATPGARFAEFLRGSSCERAPWTIRPSGNSSISHNPQEDR